ncbi:MAG: transporter substrate-binding domain-containing protein [Clostridiales bacterium]|nr:transporter substrate-binding domain-containing protein [Clostridiales bacterium]
MTIKKILSGILATILVACVFAACSSNDSTGDIAGIDVDIAQAIADKLGMELEINDVKFDSIIAEVTSGKADFGMAGMTVTEDRLQNVNFTDTYITSRQVIIVRNATEDTDDLAANTVFSIDDLEDKKIGVQLGTTGDIYVEEDYGSDAVVQYNSGYEAVLALIQGKVDAVVIDEEPAKVFVAENDGKLRILDEEFTEEEYAICVDKDNTELLNQLNTALNELIADGTVQSIIDNYIGDDAGQSPYESPADADRSNGKLMMATNAEFPPYEYKTQGE